MNNKKEEMFPRNEIQSKSIYECLW